MRAIAASLANVLVHKQPQQWQYWWKNQQECPMRYVAASMANNVVHKQPHKWQTWWKIQKECPMRVIDASVANNLGHNNHINDKLDGEKPREMPYEGCICLIGRWFSS